MVLQSEEPVPVIRLGDLGTGEGAESLWRSKGKRRS